MTPTDPTTLADVLPILQHPEYGERVCKAAGCELRGGKSPYIRFKSNGLSVNYELWSRLDAWALAALAFGVLSVLDQERDGDETIGICDAFRYALDHDFHSADILAAAYRVWLDE